MISALLVATLTVDQVDHILGLSAEAHRKVKSEQIVAQLTTTDAAGKKSTTYTIAREVPARFAITVNDDADPSPPRRWMFGAGQVIVMEPSTEKYMVHNTPAGTTIEQSLEQELPNIDQFARLLLKQNGLEEWAEINRQVPYWKHRKGQPILAFDQPNLGGKMVFDPVTHRITELVTRVGQTTSSYKITYSDLPQKDPFQVGENAYQVAMLSDPADLPDMNAETKAFVSKLLRNYEPPRSIAYQVQDDFGTADVYYTRKGVYQASNNARMQYNGKQMVIAFGGKTYRGAARQEQFLAGAEQAGTRVDPMLRDLIMGVNPVGRILESTDEARLAGRATVDGESCTVLKAENDNLVLTFYVRQSDQFIKKIETTLPSTPNYKGVRTFKKLKDASTPPEIEASSARPLTEFLN